MNRGGQAVFSAQGTESAFFTGPSVKIFQHCLNDENFTFGWEKSLSVGVYDRETLDPGGKNDSISAIYIPEGFTVVAHQNYIDDAETGKTWTWVGPLNKTCLADGSGEANDQISYLKITYEDPNGGSTDTACDDPNRKKKTDGSCDEACNTGYELSTTTGKCVASSSEEEEEEDETNWVLYGGLALVVVLVLVA